MRKIKELYEIVCALAALLGRTADFVCERVASFLERHQRFSLIIVAVCFLMAWTIEG